MHCSASPRPFTCRRMCCGGMRSATPNPAAELVRLWFKIPSQEQRAAIMRVIRDAADEASLKRT